MLDDNKAGVELEGCQQVRQCRAGWDSTLGPIYRESDGCIN